MPYCPSCHCEYEANATVCAECDKSLVAGLEATTEEDMEDLFVCTNEAQMERALGLLRDAGVEALVREHNSTMFPMKVGMMAERIIAVPCHRASEARAVLQAAMDDHVLVREGSFAEVRTD